LKIDGLKTGGLKTDTVKAGGLTNIYHHRGHSGRRGQRMLGELCALYGDKSIRISIISSNRIAS
jgi:hypothetical protein